MVLLGYILKGEIIDLKYEKDRAGEIIEWVGHFPCTEMTHVWSAEYLEPG